MAKKTVGNPEPKIRGEFSIPSAPKRATNKRGLLTVVAKDRLKRLAHAQLNYGRGHA
jgi:hypothetical protein